MQFVIQTTWGHLVAWYLFLAGAGAGLYLIAIGLKKWHKCPILGNAAYYLSPLLVAAGTIFLLLDLGHPFRAMLAILRPHSSMISVGTLILTLFLLVTFWQAYAAFRKKDQLPVWDWAGVVLAAGTAAYTGLLLGVVKAIPFWNNPLLPVLFVLSALSSGLGLILVLQGRFTWIGKLDQAYLKGLLHFDMGLVAVEAIMIVCWLIVALHGSAAAVVSAQLLLSGFLAVPFWLLVIGAGIVTPVILKMTKAGNATCGYTGIGIALMAGALALRYSVVMAGVWLPL